MNIPCFFIEPTGEVVKEEFPDGGSSERPKWRRVDTGEVGFLDSFPVGAMFYSDWMDYKGPDGKCLSVRTPGGYWMIDGPSTQHPEGNAWTRTGVPPKVTAMPSIIAGNYHGWLRDGVLMPA